MALTKAQIEILDTAAIDSTRGLTPVIEVQFNPTEAAFTKGAQIAEIAVPGLDSPLLQFVSGQNERLTLDLFFDTTSEGMGEQALDVGTKTRGLFQLVKVQPRTHAPPRVRFVWGQNLSFQALVESVRQTFTLFSPLGVPLRATLAVGFREYKSLSEQLQELNLQSPDHTRQYVVRRGDTLPRIAAEEYGDPGAWRVIVDHKPNRGKVPNPRRLAAGTILELPPLNPLNPQTPRIR